MHSKSGVTTFSKIDLVKAYYQIALADEKTHLLFVGFGNLNIIRGGQSSLEMYLSKSIVTYSKNTQAKVESNDRYFFLSKTKKVVENLTAELVKVDSSFIF